MNKTFVNKKFFNDTKPILTDYNSESSLYIKNHELAKIIKPNYRKEKEETINNLEKLYHKNIANPSSILYDKTGTIGYTMFYYSLYSTIDKIISDKNIDYKKRKEIVKKIYEVFEYFEKNKFAYDDVHDKNILVDESDIIVVDLDCGLFKNRTNSKEYDIKERLKDMRLTKLVLSILYDVPFYKIENYFNNEYFLKRVPNNIEELFKYVINGKFIHFDSSEYLDLLTEDTINDTKLTLK